MRDRVEKFDEYEQAGVGEYWVVDVRPRRERVDFWVLGPDSHYRNAPPTPGGVYCSRTLSGFWLRVEWLLLAPPPDVLPALAEVVGLPAPVTQALDAIRDRGPATPPE